VLPYAILPVEVNFPPGRGEYPPDPLGNLLVSAKTVAGGWTAQVETIGSPAVRPKTATDGRTLGIDLAFYLACMAFALGSAIASEFYGYRVWGDFATVGYGLAAAHTCWLLAGHRHRRERTGPLRSRWIGLGFVGTLAMLVPLIVLVIRRLTGVDWLITPFSWSAQPEVWVIERSASLLLKHGTPYVDVTALGRPPVVNDYTPYGPVMSVFGLPRALFGGGPLANALTDARLYFALVACLCVLSALRLLRWPRVPVAAAQLALACPLTALTWSVAGPDLAIVGLLVLAVALATRDKPALSAVVLAMVVSAKLIVAPAVLVLAVLVLARQGKRTLAWFAGVFVGASVVFTLPTFLVAPKPFVEHVIRFPSGLGVVVSPAASPLPGHLLAGIPVAGKAIAFVVLGAAAVAVLVWLVRRPPTTGSDALLRTAVGLGAAILLSPATRYGYLVYPLVLLGAMLVFRGAETPRVEPEPESTMTPPATTVTAPATSS